MKYIRAWIAAALSAAALVEFVFWGGAGVGITLLFLTLTAAYYIACGFPRGGKIRITEHVLLLVTTILLAFTYSLFANQSLRILNFPVLGLLLGVLFLHGSLGDKNRVRPSALSSGAFCLVFCETFSCDHKAMDRGGRA